MSTLPELEPSPRGVLLIDDDLGLCEFLEAALTREGYRVFAFNDARAALAALPELDVDVAVTDVNMEGVDGLEFTRRALELRPGLLVIFITGEASVETAVSAIRLGAWDYLVKPIEAHRLVLSVSRARQHLALSREVHRLNALQPPPGAPSLLGESVGLRKVLAMVDRVASTDVPVLIRGESGTGKELVARALHQRSERAAGPFIAINCAALPASLVESELFGHAKGAFTDARTDKKGLFLEAQDGTLFLDELGELPLDTQAKLLRVLQEKKVRPVGGASEEPFNARLVAATNKDLETEVQEKRFREDLYYRINVVRIDVPPLRERPADVLPLAHEFIQRASASGPRKVKGLSHRAAERVLAYDWPGNVRELENAMQSAVAMASFDELSVDDLPGAVRSHRSQRVVLTAETEAELITLKALEVRYLERVLSLVGGNKSRAAEILGVDRRTLYRMLERNAEE
ncbi:MAG: sigma-54 dependent transcriptional regulator [Myxococcales bacterium]|nr:sigma-54 dependent transcriptional regulator [Myxococcales bacterium]